MFNLSPPNFSFWHLQMRSCLELPNVMSSYPLLVLPLDFLEPPQVVAFPYIPTFDVKEPLIAGEKGAIEVHPESFFRP